MTLDKMTKGQILAAAEEGTVIDLSTVLHRDYSVVQTAETFTADATALTGVGDIVTVGRAMHAFGAFFASDMVGPDKLYTDGNAYAAAIGVSKGQVTKYKRLGRLYFVHNVRPDVDNSLRPLWMRLAQDVNSLKTTRDLIDGEAATVDAIRAAIVADDEAARLKAAGGGTVTGPTVTPDGETVGDGGTGDGASLPVASGVDGKTESVTDLFSHLHSWVARMIDTGDGDALADLAARCDALAAAVQTASETVAAAAPETETASK